MVGTEMELLKQATQSMISSEFQDALNDSDSSNRTPRSGIATPHPDLADKRLPGIMHSYFGQVRFASSTTSNLGLLEPFTFKSSPKNLVSLNDKEKLSSAEVLSLVATDPTIELGSSGEKKTSLIPEKLSSKITHLYPTPPVSHNNFVRCSHNNINTGDELEIRASKGEQSSLKYSRCPEIISRPPSLTRRLSMAPLTSILTALHISALMSNPSDDCKSVSSGLSSRSSLTSEFRKFPSIDQLKQLTVPPSKKSISLSSTRDLSNHTTKLDTNVNSNAAQPKNKLIVPESIQADLTPLTIPVAPTPAPFAKGRLVVKIAEARGLRKCRDPYVVAVFQRNELVSKGPLPVDEKRDEAFVGSPNNNCSSATHSASDSGKPMAIPMKSRQSSMTSTSDHRDFKKLRKSMTNPTWDTKAVFDVVGTDPRILITVYDRATTTEEFIGNAELYANITEKDSLPIRGWFKLRDRNDNDSAYMGEIYVEVTFQRTEKKHYGPEDFQILKLIGKGTFGQVYQVRKKDTQRIYAMKVLQKKVIVQKKEVAHTVGERNILVRTAMAESPFIVGLKFSFQTPTDLYLVTDYMSGGELFWHLQKDGRFDEKRAKFYIAELILALQHLHMHNIVYRDLKPENILLDANGHIALCDFGLSKANLMKNDTTRTFCGTTEYLAPEVLLNEAGYTKMVDFWSLGVLVFEMCCGWSPFYADDIQQMYKNIAFGKVRFPRDTLTTEGRHFVKGLLNRNPKHRLGAIDDAEELKRHPFFADIDWDLLTAKKITPSFKPKLESETDTSNFDPEFTNALNEAGSLNARAAALATGMATSTPLSPGMQANFKGFTFVDESFIEEQMASRNCTDDWDAMENKRPYDHDSLDKSNNRINRDDSMSGVYGGIGVGGEDSMMFNGYQFDL